MLREILLTVAEDQAEALSDQLLAAGALAVSVEDADADTDAELALFGEPGAEPQRLAWRRNRLLVLVGPGVDPAVLLAQASAEAGHAVPAFEATRVVEDADWVRLTQAQFPPTRIAARLWIVPSWHEPPDRNAINIRLDPGVAFGTGTHPTTRLCLAWLVASLRGGERVLDYGCGSGVLAIAAARLGAGEVVGTDIDAQALQAARDNSLSNGVAARYTAPDALPQGRYDVVLANILSNPLKLLAPALLARVGAGGALVLSGVLQRQAQEVVAAYAAIDPGLRLTVWDEQDGWVCLAGRRD